MRVAGPATVLHLIVVADGHDAIANDRDRGVNREVAIDGDHLAVEQHQVRCGRPRQEGLAARRGQRRDNDHNRKRRLGSPRKHTPPLPLSSSQQIAPYVPRAGRSPEASRYSDPMGSTSSPGVDDTAARLIVTPLVGIGRAEPRRHDRSRRAHGHRAGRDVCVVHRHRIHHVGSEPPAVSAVSGSDRVADAAVAPRPAADRIDLPVHDSVYGFGAVAVGSAVPGSQRDLAIDRDGGDHDRGGGHRSSRTSTKRCSSSRNGNATASAAIS